MKPLTKAARLVHVEGKMWKKYLHKFLLNYQTILHCTTGFTPAQLNIVVKTFMSDYIDL